MSDTLSIKDLTSDPPALIATILVALLVLTAVVGPLLVPYKPDALDLDHLREPPSKAHLLGTDSKGRDLLSRVVGGARISLSVGVSASILSLFIGIFFGLIAGYFGGRTDAVLSQLFDIFLAFPSLLLAIGISAVMPPGLTAAMLAITLVGWAGFARLVRGITLSLKERTYVEASRASGQHPRESCSGISCRMRCRFCSWPAASASADSSCSRRRSPSSASVSSRPRPPGAR